MHFRRAQTLLDLYRKALPEKKREPADETPPDTEDDNPPPPRPEKKGLFKALDLPRESGESIKPTGESKSESSPAETKSVPVPRIVKSLPVTGTTTVDAGIREIAVTFNQDMDQGMSWTGFASFLSAD